MPDPELLQASVLDQYLQRRPFVRRRWLAATVDRHLDDDSCRHVLITAEAGMGKSSLMAWLTTWHRLSPRYFIRLDSLAPFGSGDATTLLVAIGRQLAHLCPEAMTDRPLRIEVTQETGRVGAGGRSVGLRTGRLIANPFRRTEITVSQHTDRVDGVQVAIDADEVVDTEWRLDPALLQQLALLDPARKLAELDPTAKIIVLVDGLDELRHQPPSPSWDIVDWLVHCPQLPPNVRVVVASRPDPELLGRYRLRQRGRLREIAIDPADRHVLDDVKDYADSFADDRKLRRTLEGRGLSLRDSARAAAARAAGNFLYLVSWARALEHAVSARRWTDVARLAEQDGLPGSLTDLYDLFVLMLRDTARRQWVSVHRRVLGVFTVSRGPLSTDQLAVMAGLPVDIVDRAVGDMLQFLTVSAGRAAIFHISLADYLTAEETRVRSPLSWIDAAVSNREVAAELIAAHGADWSACADEYALANVVAHLVSALTGEQNDRQWCADAVVAVLADEGFVTRKAAVVGSVRTVVDFVDAFEAVRAAFPEPAERIPRALAIHCVRGAEAAFPADVLHAGLGYRAEFDEFHGLVLTYLADLDFVTEHAPGGSDVDLAPVSIWADFAEITASRHRRHNDLDAAQELLEQITHLRGDQSRALYERGYLHHLHGRVDEALDHLDESAEAADQAGRGVSRWISAVVRDEIKLFAGRLDPNEYRGQLDQALEFFVGEAETGNPHAERWVTNVHDKRMTLACLLGDAPAAEREWEVLREDGWARRERPLMHAQWQARLALVRGEFARARSLFETVLGPDPLTAEPAATEGVARTLLDYGRALAGAGDRRSATLAWRQVLRCSDTSGAWPWKARAQELLGDS
ncbi:hypothetical protein [Actinokineospora sp.]|uniref:hypothetical protein n=1 Tax=Actinokineospora sp. TaxID=1872133 RepID=UPI0040384016